MGPRQTVCKVKRLTHRALQRAPPGMRMHMAMVEGVAMLIVWEFIKTNGTLANCRWAVTMALRSGQMIDRGQTSRFFQSAVVSFTCELEDDHCLPPAFAVGALRGDLHRGLPLLRCPALSRAGVR